MRVGILGGVFNPPHLAHLVCAQEAHLRLGLDQVSFVPVAEAPHRQIELDPGAEARLEMCDRATAHDERLAVSWAEVDRGGPSYTVETLRLLRERSGEDEHYLIMGADQASALPEWREPEEILALATIAVAERDGARRREVGEAVSALKGADRLEFFDMPRVDISSTLVRQRALAGEPIRYLVPDPVADFIEERGLYPESTAAGAE